MTQPKKSPGKNSVALLGKVRGQEPLFQSAWAYTAQGMSGSGLYSTSGVRKGSVRYGGGPNRAG